MAETPAVRLAKGKRVAKFYVAAFNEGDSLLRNASES
ncbi:hypothetical protein ABIE13_002427 [Ottowia thiooxydans]|uniref:Uncharacterized protein n=1 Tax=Ottowia thiooxydans TaxID=219182 RepID=A0ABV2Q8E8_9BURK